MWTLILRGLDSGPCGGTEAHSFVSGQQQGTQDSGQDGHHSHEHCFFFFLIMILTLGELRRFFLPDIAAVEAGGGAVVQSC